MGVLGCARLHSIILIFCRFLKNFSGHNSPINALAVNEDGVAVSCGDNGSIDFWDYDTGYCFQKSNTIAQPGSLDAECGIYAAGFDLSGRYMFVCHLPYSDTLTSPYFAS